MNKIRLASTLTAFALLFLFELPAQSDSEFRAQRAPRKAGHTIFTLKSADVFGGVLPGLTAAQLAAFADGGAAFAEEDDAASGLGPIFNDVGCARCHTDPEMGGGSSTRFVTRFGRATNGTYDPLAELGGSLLQENAIDPHAKEAVPPQANVVIHRRTTPLFGLGLIEAIPDGAIIMNALKAKSPGVGGRAAFITDVASGETRIGRFGWKAQQATILAFAGDAYMNEIGITNPPNGNTALLAQYDTVADPEDTVDPATGRGDIDAFADFMRFLAPPPTVPSTSDSRQGAIWFSQVGCDECHTPVMYTARNSIKALDRKPVALYSDLLLHDMGSSNDGIVQADADAEEMKTPPLWGIRAVSAFMHDGRASTLDEAIRMHDGEGASSRDLYLQLPPNQQLQLIVFLNSI